MNTQPSPVLAAEKLRKVYRRGAEEIAAVDGVDISVAEGDFVAVVGPSGSGKTTLLNVLGCLDSPTSGKLLVAGRTVFEGRRGLPESSLTRIRREAFGYIFQRFYLIPTLTLLENVMVPFAFYRKNGRTAGVMDILRKLGLEDRTGHRPGELSGGEMQRAAIARALVNRPRVLLADEPTGNLDTVRSREIGSILKQLNENDGLTVVLVTHNPELASIARRVIELKDGKIERVRPA
jgi:putative ABC transport system ATP-binding protein